MGLDPRYKHSGVTTLGNVILRLIDAPQLAAGCSIFGLSRREIQSVVRRFVPLATLVLALSFVLLAKAVGAESKQPWQQEWEKVTAGAKKEGEVRLWGDQEITHPDIVAAFSRQYPYIKVVTVTGRVGDLMPRIIAERRAGKYLADLYSGGLGGRAFYDFMRAGV